MRICTRPEREIVAQSLAVFSLSELMRMHIAIVNDAEAALDTGDRELVRRLISVAEKLRWGIEDDQADAA